MVKRGDSWKMDINVLTVGPIQTNCYVVHQEGNSQCVVIDPGEEAAKIADFLKRKGLECKGILLTHGHFDHIIGVPEVKRAFHIPVYASETEDAMLADTSINLSCHVPGKQTSFHADVLVHDGQHGGDGQRHRGGGRRGRS